MKKIDERMEWEGFGNGFGKWPSSCRIRIYENDGMEIVVATQAEDDPGTSVTNCVEAVAMMAIGKYKMDPKKFVFIQQEIAAKGFGKKGEDVFCTVTFSVQMAQSPLALDKRAARMMLTAPIWKPLKRGHVESLIGEALDA